MYFFTLKIAFWRLIMMDYRSPQEFHQQCEKRASWENYKAYMLQRSTGNLVNISSLYINDSSYRLGLKLPLSQVSQPIIREVLAFSCWLCIKTISLLAIWVQIRESYILGFHKSPVCFIVVETGTSKVVRMLWWLCHPSIGKLDAL